MIDDVTDLLREEARIDGVADGADAGGGVIELEMPIGVPGKRADAVAFADAKGSEGVGELRSPGIAPAIVVAVNRPFDAARDDLGLAVIFRRVVEQGDEEKRGLHHQAVERRHRRSCPLSGAAPGIASCPPRGPAASSRALAGPAFAPLSSPHPRARARTAPRTCR